MLRLCSGLSVLTTSLILIIREHVCYCLILYHKSSLLLMVTKSSVSFFILIFPQLFVWGFYLTKNFAMPESFPVACACLLDGTVQLVYWPFGTGVNCIPYYSCEKRSTLQSLSF